MKRKIEQDLLAWKNSTLHKPLVLQGARQVGKTYSALKFGAEQYANTAYFNFEGEPEIKDYFKRSLNPDKLIPLLSNFVKQSIQKEQTLIIFDEIQACPAALTALKYFNEQAPEYHIIATGSLMGIALNKRDESENSFPVGNVDFLNMNPLDFQEFLWAIDEDYLQVAIQEHTSRVLQLQGSSNSAFLLHEQALKILRNYLVLGGMPEAVASYSKYHDYNLVHSTQLAINTAYVGDMAKYAEPSQTVRIRQVWDSMHNQLSKENKKFQYSVIKSGARAAEYETPLFWLELARLLNRCNCVNMPMAPLSAYDDSTFFKMYLMDCGILFSTLGVNAQRVLAEDATLGFFNGILAENFVMQALVARSITPRYLAKASKIEIDFLVQNTNGDVIPIEVKWGTNVKSKSLQSLTAKHRFPYAVRISAKNFGYENNIKAVPLYALPYLEFQ